MGDARGYSPPRPYAVNWNSCREARAAATIIILGIIIPPTRTNLLCWDMPQIGMSAVFDRHAAPVEY